MDQFSQQLKTVEAAAQKALGPGDNALVTASKTSAMDVAKQFAGLVTPALSQLLIFIFTLLLYVGSRHEIRNQLVMTFERREQRLSVLRSYREAEARLTKYMVTVTLINLGVGAVVGAALFAANVPGALGWGLLAFCVNFLPIVGPLIMKLVLLGFGLVTYPNILSGLIPVAIYATVSLVESNVITPRIVGNAITMNPLVVFLTVILGTWMWGFVGAFLAMPILAIASVIKQEFAKSDAPNLPG